MNEHERGFLDFLAEPTKRRMATLLALGEKRRPDVRALLDHSVRLHSLSCKHLTGNEADAGSVAATLRSLGAPPTCFVVSADSNLDGREMLLGDALDAIVARGNGAFVSCIPGRLGFYEYEDMRSSYLLTR